MYNVFYEFQSLKSIKAEKFFLHYYKITQQQQLYVKCFLIRGGEVVIDGKTYGVITT